MKENVRPLTGIDVLAVPLMVILSAFLQMWVSVPTAVATSVVLVLLTFSLFQPRAVTYQRFILLILLIGAATYILAALYVRLTG